MTLTIKWIREELRYGRGRYAKQCSQTSARTILDFIRSNGLKANVVIDWFVNYLESRKRNTILKQDLQAMQEHFKKS